jgi:serine/threonine-protein kinase
LDGNVHENTQNADNAEQVQAERDRAKPGIRTLIGSTISDRYLIQRLLGEGGMGAVYQAEHTLMRKRMAIKVLHPEMTRLPEVVARFEREAMAAAHIDHPHVVTATDFGKLEDGSFFLALEFVEGSSLRDVVAGGRLELGRALHIARQIASALHRAHALKIVHRDLKPENVMLVERDGDPDFVKVLDFGIAKVQMGELGTNDRDGPEQSILTQAGMIYGTPEYMAPEQALGQPVDARADLYALGVMTYEMLTGRRPFEAESKVALLGMQVTAPVPPMASKSADANVPSDVEALVSRLLTKEATDRVADAREVIDGITALLAQLSAAGKVDARFVPPPANGFGTSPGYVTGISHPLLPELASGQRTSTHSVEPASSGRGWLVILVAGMLGLAVLVAAVVYVFKTRELVGVASSTPDGTVAARDASADTPDARAAATSPAVDERIKDAVAMIERGDYGSGIQRLDELGDAVQGREDVHRALMTAYSATGKMKEAMREAGLVLRANPSLDLTKEVKFRVEIRDLALKEGGKDIALKPAVDDAFALLEGQMGYVGWDDLYDVGYGTAGSLYPKAATRARAALGRGDHSKMAPALQVTLDLQAAGLTCNAKPLLDRAAKEGDERTLVVLRPLATAHAIKQQGFRRVDGLLCLHDGSVTRALSTLEDRVRAQKRK